MYIPGVYLWHYSKFSKIFKCPFSHLYFSLLAKFINKRWKMKWNSTCVIHVLVHTPISLKCQIHVVMKILWFEEVLAESMPDDELRKYCHNRVFASATWKWIWTCIKCSHWAISLENMSSPSDLRPMFIFPCIMCILDIISHTLTMSQVPKLMTYHSRSRSVPKTLYYEHFPLSIFCTLTDFCCHRQKKTLAESIKLESL
jgi:hypothetical protein